MKKFFAVITVFLCTNIFCINNVNKVFAQNQASSTVKNANRNTALRCLKLAENCLLGEDWENAVKQADLGLSYDENISDLLYIKASAQVNLGSSKADVLEILRNAFTKNEWVGYTKNGARIIYADLLCDTGLYEESLKVLDSDPLLFNADAEYIRIKNYYRMQTPLAINNARLKLNSARRIYPNDERFANIFFLFETLFLAQADKMAQSYEIPEIVKTISNAYIAKLPDYSGNNTKMEIMATFFADKETANRLVSAIYTKNPNADPLLSISLLKNELITDTQALISFFESFENEIPLDLLEYISSLIKTDEAKMYLIEKLSDFNGTIIIDENLDLQNEIQVTYENGRPSYIKYDINNDDITDLYSSCDLGAPLFVYYNETKSQIFYDGFPKVNKVTFIEEDYNFSFIHDDFTYTPYELLKNKYLEANGVDFYVPVFEQKIEIPEIQKIALKASNVELPVKERDNAKVVFTINESQLVYASYFENERKYATCDFTTGLPYTRYVDYDNDSHFETLEIYDQLQETQGFDLQKENALVQKVFTEILSTQNIYLQKVMIDRNANTKYEFSEQYIEHNGKITLWDNDDNGIWDCQCIRYPQKTGENLVEETIFYEDNGLEKILLKTVDNVPVKLLFGESEVLIYAGTFDNFYWIEKEGNSTQEKMIIEEIKDGITQGAIQLISLGEERASLIKVNENIYCRLIPSYEN